MGKNDDKKKVKESQNIEKIKVKERTRSSSTDARSIYETFMIMLIN